MFQGSRFNKHNKQQNKVVWLSLAHPLGTSLKFFREGNLNPHPTFLITHAILLTPWPTPPMYDNIAIQQIAFQTACVLLGSDGNLGCTKIYVESMISSYIINVRVVKMPVWHDLEPFPCGTVLTPSPRGTVLNVWNSWS